MADVRWIARFARRAFERVARVFSSLQCPLCGVERHTFLPYGERPRHNALCPSCGALERHRFLWLYLTTRPELADARNVLHLAPEPCLAERIAARSTGLYLGIDRYVSAAQAWHDLTALGLRARTFDLVLCFHVLEHVPDDRRAMRELFRVTRPGGWLLVHVPLAPLGTPTDEDPSIEDPAERTSRFGLHNHVRLYGLDIVDRLREAGYEVRTESCRLLFGERAIRRHALLAGRSADNILFACRKPDPL